MSTSLPSGSPSPSQNPAPDAPLAPNFEDQLREFWIKYSRAFYTVSIAVLIVILVKGGYDYYLAQKEKTTGAEYNAANTNDKLRAFAASHQDHILGGVALLRLADEAYSAGKYTEAVANYNKAAEILTQDAFGGRARLGSAISQVLAGQKVEGEKALSTLAADAKQLKTVRAEAAYHAGVLALEAGRNDDAAKAFEQSAALDPASSWGQRATLKKTSIPAK